ncbi:MAG: ribosomal protein L22/L17 [Monoraphidium minutum]|nr:MAG: ribosomal protein L22/L17 [Monoraphidium minutum]
MAGAPLAPLLLRAGRRLAAAAGDAPTVTAGARTAVVARGGWACWLQRAGNTGGAAAPSIAQQQSGAPAWGAACFGSGACAWPRQQVHVQQQLQKQRQHLGWQQRRAFASSGAAPATPAGAPAPSPPQQQRQPQQQQRQQKQQEADAVGVCRRKSLPMGWKKLDFVLPLARRRSVDDALAQLAACPKRAARAVRDAVANARNNAVAQGADPAALVVERVWTGRAPPFKKPWFHGRGYSSVRQRRRTHLTVVVQQAAAPAGRAHAPAKLVRPAMLRPRRERRFPRPGQLPAAGGGAAA